MWFVTFRSNQRLTHSVHTTFSYCCFLQVEITLQDINDNPPVFPTDMLDLTVEENIGDGSKILQLTAMDADEVGAWFCIWISVLKMLSWKYVFLSVPFIRAWPWESSRSCFKLHLAHSQNCVRYHGVTKRQTYEQVRQIFYYLKAAHWIVYNELMFSWHLLMSGSTNGKISPIFWF